MGVFVPGGTHHGTRGPSFYTSPGVPTPKISNCGSTTLSNLFIFRLLLVRRKLVLHRRCTVTPHTSHRPSPVASVCPSSGITEEVGASWDSRRVGTGETKHRESGWERRTVRRGGASGTSRFNADVLWGQFSRDLG